MSDLSHAAASALPIEAELPSLAKALTWGHALLAAPTGSGKTTRVPLALLEESWLSGRTILMLEPRRPAARMAAARMAAMLGEAVGETVGHQVRFERVIGPNTRIQVLTEGILTRRLQSDPELDGCGLIIFDEFHERSLNADLGLALALDAASLRPDLRILVMSATLDSATVAGLLGDAPVIEGKGRSHPVEIRYADHSPNKPVDALTTTLRLALREQDGDILAFLPGAAEIDRVAGQLGGIGDVDLLPLHGGLSLPAQDRALRPDGGSRRRVVLATDIAETSLTIEGIVTVVDSGLTRKPRYEPGSGLSRLVTEPISRASADQRAGRAGRLRPGICYRLWTQAEHQGRPAHRPAEILQSDLAPLVLELALWGVADPDLMRWLEPPPAGAWARGVELLQTLGAIDSAGKITQAGRRMASLPLHPRLAKMLAETPANAMPLAADLAALLEERDPWSASRDCPRPIDLTPRLGALGALRARRRIDGFDARRLGRIDQLSSQYRRLLRGNASTAPKTRINTDQSHAALHAGALLAMAYPDRVAQNRGGT
ncbi:MAG: ATP-dependent helicase HrpB, partial [Thiohalocapsa sp.]